MQVINLTLIVNACSEFSRLMSAKLLLTRDGTTVDPEWNEYDY